jgi:integrase
MAEVVRIHQANRPVEYATAVDRYLAAASIGPASARVYRVALHTWAWLLAGDQPPAGPARRGAASPLVELKVLDDPSTPARLSQAFTTRAAAVDADTVNRELSVLRAAVGWWRRQGWIHADPTVELERRPAPPDRTRALGRDQIAALFALKVRLREKTYWQMLYETAARAEEILGLDVEDLDLANKRARVVSKGGTVDWVHWQSATAALLPRLLKGRTRGPVFLTDRAAAARTPTLDVCPVTSRARMSYRRAAELFTAATRRLTRRPDGSDGNGWTLHQLRHSALTHEAEDDTNTPPCCLPGAATRASAHWSATPAPAPRRSRATSPTATPPPGADDRPLADDQAMLAAKPVGYQSTGSTPPWAADPSRIGSRTTIDVCARHVAQAPQPPAEQSGCSPHRTLGFMSTNQRGTLP